MYRSTPQPESPRRNEPATPSPSRLHLSRRMLSSTPVAASSPLVGRTGTQRVEMPPISPIACRSPYADMRQHKSSLDRSLERLGSPTLRTVSPGRFPLEQSYNSSNCVAKGDITMLTEVLDRFHIASPPAGVVDEEERQSEPASPGLFDISANIRRAAAMVNLASPNLLQPKKLDFDSSGSDLSKELHSMSQDISERSTVDSDEGDKASSLPVLSYVPPVSHVDESDSRSVTPLVTDHKRADVSGGSDMSLCTPEPSDHNTSPQTSPQTRATSSLSDMSLCTPEPEEKEDGKLLESRDVSSASDMDLCSSTNDSFVIATAPARPPPPNIVIPSLTAHAAHPNFDELRIKLDDVLADIDTITLSDIHVVVVLRKLGLPVWFKAAVKKGLVCVGRVPVTALWYKIMNMYQCCTNAAEMMSFILCGRPSGFFPTSALAPVVLDVVDSHPDLFHLKGTKFVQPYVDVVLARVEFWCGAAGTGKLTGRKLEDAGFLDAVSSIDSVFNPNSSTNVINDEYRFFAYEQFVSLFSLYTRCGGTVDTGITADQLHTGRLEYVPLSVCHLLCERLPGGEMNLPQFTQYLMADLDRHTKESVRYWFSVLDEFGAGEIGMGALMCHYMEIHDHLESRNVQTLHWKQICSMVIDLVKPADSNKLTLAELLNGRAYRALVVATNAFMFIEQEATDAISEPPACGYFSSLLEEYVVPEETEEEEMQPIDWDEEEEEKDQGEEKDEEQEEETEQGEERESPDSSIEVLDNGEWKKVD